MEIVYIWLKNYKDIIIEQGFNFGAKYIYEYKDNILIQRKNPNYLKGFFGAKITNITGIIGKNGVGKSTLLNFIKENFTKSLANLEEEAIVVYNINNEETILKHDSIEIKNANEFKKLKVFNKFDDEKLDIGIINFSNIFNINYSMDKHHDNLFDISTNYLIRKDKDTNVDEVSENHSLETLSHEIAELHRQIEYTFRSNIGEKFIDFDLPLEISLSPVDIEYFDLYILFDSFFDDTEVYEEFIGILMDVNNINKEIRYKAKVVNNLISNFLYTILENRDFKNKYFTYVKEYLKRKLNDKFYLSNDVITIGIEFFSGLTFSKDENEVQHEEIKINNLIEGSKSLINFINDSNKSNFLKGNLIVNNSERIKEVLNFYEDTLFFARFLEFRWSNLSSGQYAMLSIFSRIYDIKNGIGNKKLNNIIVLIDEAELYFHPQWQKKIVNLWIKTLDKMFEKNPEITFHLIITSNSPFIISDLPSDNIIFLDDGEYYKNTTNENKSTIKGKCIVVPNEEIKSKTFGSNIHTLYTKSFFIKEGLIGDFALNKITKVIKSIKKDDPDYKNYLTDEQIEHHISIIGEPVISRKLNRMYNNQIEEILKLQKENEELKKEMHLLKGKINKTGGIDDNN